MTKFFSKAASYTLVVRPATTVVHINGIPQTVPGEYIRFEDGVFKTENQDTVKFLMENPAFGRDYVADTDNFQATRKPIEPEHSINIMEFGHVGKQLNPVKDTKVELQKMIMEEAKKIAQVMISEILKSQSVAKKDEPAPAPVKATEPVPAPKKKAGRPPHKPDVVASPDPEPVPEEEYPKNVVEVK